MANGAAPHSVSGHKAEGIEDDTELDGGWDDEPAPTSIAPAPASTAKAASAPAPSVAPYRPSVGAPAPAALSALLAQVAAKSPSMANVPIALTTQKPPSVAPKPIALTTRKAPSVAPQPAAAVTPALPAVAASKVGAAPVTPVSAVPRPRSYTPPPPAVEAGAAAPASVLEKPTAAPAPAPAPAGVSTSAKSASVQVPSAGAVRASTGTEEAGTLRPSEVEPPVAGTRRRSLARFVASLGIAAAMVLASLAWLKDGGQTASKQLSQLFAPAAPPPAAPAADPPPTQAPAAEARAADAPMLPGAVITAVEPAPTVPAPPVAPPPLQATGETPSSAAPGTVAATPAKPGSTHVTIKTVPAGAAVFQAGKRLGTGLVELDVEPKMKHRLTALLDGHRPVNFTVDGSRETVTIMLKRVPRVAPSPTGEAADESGAALPTDTQAPAPAEATDPAATP